MVEAWYSKAIGKIRFTADPGGEALTVEETQERITELENAIKQAEND